jgi:hypothetical protein
MDNCHECGSLVSRGQACPWCASRSKRAESGAIADAESRSAEAPFLWIDSPTADGDGVEEAISEAASTAADGAGGLLQAVAHAGGEVLKTLGDILSALGEADLGDW